MAGSDIHAQDNSGRTSLHLAAYSGSVECVEFLIQNGAEFNVCDSYGRLV